MIFAALDLSFLENFLRLYWLCLCSIRCRIPQQISGQCRTTTTVALVFHTGLERWTRQRQSFSFAGGTWASATTQTTKVAKAGTQCGTTETWVRDWSPVTCGLLGSCNPRHSWIHLATYILCTYRECYIGIGQHLVVLTCVDTPCIVKKFSCVFFPGEAKAYWTYWK